MSSVMEAQQRAELLGVGSNPISCTKSNIHGWCKGNTAAYEAVRYGFESHAMYQINAHKWCKGSMLVFETTGIGSSPILCV